MSLKDKLSRLDKYDLESLEEILQEVRIDVVEQIYNPPLFRYSSSDFVDIHEGEEVELLDYRKEDLDKESFGFGRFGQAVNDFAQSWYRRENSLDHHYAYGLIIIPPGVSHSRFFRWQDVNTDTLRNDDIGTLLMMEHGGRGVLEQDWPGEVNVREKVRSYLPPITMDTLRAPGKWVEEDGEFKPFVKAKTTHNGPERVLKREQARLDYDR